MIEAADFIEAARRRGYDWYTGVPCSFLTPFINHVIGAPDLHYVAAANEGDAVALAAGIAVGGGRAIAMMQNSGLGNAVSPLTSLTWIFRLPMLIICTQRGAPGVADEPQHALMGQITAALFETMRVPWRDFPAAAPLIEDALDGADAAIAAERRPFAFIMQKGAVASGALASPRIAARPAPAGIQRHGFHRALQQRPTRSQALQRIVQRTSIADSVVIATTGYTGRELHAIDDRPNHFYMVGSMGCAPALGLGLALLQPRREIVVVDGDGAALMRLGNFATTGTYGGDNFTHIVLDNEVHDSTGAQPTVSPNVDFAGIAAACGYQSVVSGDDVALIDAVCGNPALPGPRLLHLKTAPGTIDALPRPTVTPEQVATRLMAHLADNPG